MSRNQKIAVSEYFYSLQGEGKTMGIPAIFLRLTGCNLMCGGYGVEKDGKLRDGATWLCDTIKVWMKGTTYGFASLVELLNKDIDFIQRLQNGVHLVITGGEPLLQQERIVAFLEYIEQEHGCRPIIEIETNATIQPLDTLDVRVQYWNTSPKLSNSGMPKPERIVPDVLKWFAQNPNTMSKIVIAEESDYDELEQDFIAKGYIDPKQIVLMPSADSIEELLAKNQLVADLCIQHQLRMCTRMHVEIWNQLTGV
ncbi:MAG: 7-carboxy-7-deazaguanine synthase QueE [Aureispira sp.]|nr:7-carboxy-7-deazaguanine synthase QueE [Aureispira sp.]